MYFNKAYHTPPVRELNNKFEKRDSQKKKDGYVADLKIG